MKWTRNLPILWLLLCCLCVRSCRLSLAQFSPFQVSASFMTHWQVPAESIRPGFIFTLKCKGEMEKVRCQPGILRKTWKYKIKALLPCKHVSYISKKQVNHNILFFGPAQRPDLAISVDNLLTMMHAIAGSLHCFKSIWC